MNNTRFVTSPESAPPNRTDAAIVTQHEHYLYDGNDSPTVTQQQSLTNMNDSPTSSSDLLHPWQETCIPSCYSDFIPSDSIVAQHLKLEHMKINLPLFHRPSPVTGLIPQILKPDEIVDSINNSTAEHKLNPQTIHHAQHFKLPCVSFCHHHPCYASALSLLHAFDPWHHFLVMCITGPLPVSYWTSSDLAAISIFSSYVPLCDTSLIFFFMYRYSHAYVSLGLDSPMTPLYCYVYAPLSFAPIDSISFATSSLPYCASTYAFPATDVYFYDTYDVFFP